MSLCPIYLIWSYTHTHTPIHILQHTHTHTHFFISSFTHTHTHTCTHARTHTHKHIHTHSFLLYLPHSSVLLCRKLSQGAVSIKCILMMMIICVIIQYTRSTHGNQHESMSQLFPRLPDSFPNKINSYVLAELSIGCFCAGCDVVLEEWFLNLIPVSVSEPATLWVWGRLGLH